MRWAWSGSAGPELTGTRDFRCAAGAGYHFASAISGATATRSLAMRTLSIATVTALSVIGPAAMAQEAVRFDRPIFTVEGTALCPRQAQVAAIQRAIEGNDHVAAERAIAASCRVVGPDVPLVVVARPGRYDPDVEVRVAAAAGLDPAGARGPRWALKSMGGN